MVGTEPKTAALTKEGANLQSQTRPPSPPVPAKRRSSEPREVASGQSVEAVIIQTENLSIRYGSFEAVRRVTLAIPEKQVTAIIGPSGCGKSTLLRAMNRMNDIIRDVTIDGRLLYRGEDVYGRRSDPVELRRRIGMVFQKPNPFPRSIFKNIAWGASINGFRGNMNDLVENALRRAALWDEVRDKLHQSALTLSGGQQQRLCIARSIALQPDVLLMDEPCSALDPMSTSRIEDLIDELKKQFTVVLVTHNMQQAARVADRTAFMYLGELIEVDSTAKIFTKPTDSRTQDYITGRFG